MKNNMKFWRIATTMMGIAFAVWLATPIASAQPSTTARSIAEFIQAQGTFCQPIGSVDCSFLPFVGVNAPVPSYFAWTDPQAKRAISVDYAGLANAWLLSASGGAKSLGTTTEGTVTERALPDGRAEVTIILHTKNALAWVVKADASGNFDYANGPLLFGHRAPQVLSGADAALGESTLQLVFINTAPGASLPDAVQVAFFPQPGQEVRSVLFTADASGTLRSAFGVPDGTPGRAATTQRGVFMASGKGGTADGFPAEHVNLQVVGP